MGALLVRFKTESLREDLSAIADVLRERPELPPITQYIRRSLSEGGPLAAHMFEFMCELTESMFDGNDAILRDFGDPRGISAVLVPYSCGAVMFGPLLAERLGGTDLFDPDIYARYGHLATTVVANILTPEFLTSLRNAHE